MSIAFRSAVATLDMTSIAILIASHPTTVTSQLPMYYLLLIGTIIPLIHADPCPLFSTVECPLNWQCIDNICQPASAPLLVDCAHIRCPIDTRCSSGRCYRLASLPCNRNVNLIDQHNVTLAVGSDCGPTGVCMLGRCRIDRCASVQCPIGQLCRDGTCSIVVDRFCFTAFDCGPGYRCLSNRCTHSGHIATACPNCEPGFVCQNGTCQPIDRDCALKVCDQGRECIAGSCLLVDGTRTCSPLDACPSIDTVCINGICLTDTCLSARPPCTPDQMCLNGECRSAPQGVACIGVCPNPYRCIDGYCQRDDCMRKICQLGEICDGGSCVRVADRLCSLALRDCGEAFDCRNGQCVDRILDIFNATTRS